MEEWIDVTVPIRPGMVHWPDNPGVRIECTEEMGEGGICRVSMLSLGVHTGTHFDAPNHFDVPGGGVDALPLSAFVGVARVLAVQGSAVDRADLERHDVRAGERVLFKTSNSARCWSTDEFLPDYVYVTSAAARHLAKLRVRTVGIDYLSIGGPSDGAVTHRLLLEAGVCILEGLDLRRVAPGEVDLIALPMLIRGADGAPARVLLRPRAG
jgi:arylformamidase